MVGEIKRFSSVCSDFGIQITVIELKVLYSAPPVLARIKVADAAWDHELNDRKVRLGNKQNYLYDKVAV